MVAHSNSIGAPVGVAVAPKINGAGGDIYFDTCSTAWNCSYNYSLYVIYEGGAAAKAILAADGVSSPVVGDVYPVSSLNETGPASLSGLFVDSYGNVLVADWSYNRVYMFYAGEVTGQGTNPADALLNADPAAYVVGYGLHVGYAYHIADGSNVVGAAPTNPTPHDVYVDSAENVFFTDYSSNDVEVVYNTSGTSAKTILTAEGYTSLKQGYAYMIAGGQSVATYPNDNDGGSSVAYNGATSTANTATNGPFGLSADSSGNVYFTDSLSNKIKKLSGATAVLSTIGGPAAGAATTVGHGGDGGLATAAQMNTPIGIVVSPSGAVYFADSANSSVRMISTNGYITTVAGISGTSGTYSGEGGPATSATMNTTFHLSLDANGNLYVADKGNDMIHVF
jgi:sugar lactone lactonase YvrE